MTISIIGTGFVGVVSAAVYASFGHTVYGVDIDENKVASLKNSVVPFYEPDLEQLLKTQQATGHLFFTTDYSQAIPQSDIIIIAVGTPSTQEGQVNLDYVFSACKSLAPHLKPDAIVVLKSTVPPGIAKDVESSIASLTQTPFSIASVPEFLKEGTAVHDTLHPDRVVIGTNSDKVFQTLAELHKPLQAPILRLSVESAQMAKYSSNAYLATRITFINEISDICEKNGADVEEVISAIGLDKRIGTHYWYPGLGYGGSCFPKDVKEIAAYSRSVNLHNNLFNTIDRINEERIPKIMNNLETTVGGFEGKTVAVLGLAFKPNTDDMREAPSLKVIPYLLEKGATVIGYDPKATETAKKVLPVHDRLQYALTIDEAIKQAHLIIALIEWQEITSYPFAQKKNEINTYFFDTRNQFDEQELKTRGFVYQGVGR